MVAHVLGGLAVLRLVAERPDPTVPLAVGEVARRLGRGLSGVSRLCAELERLGMLERSETYGAYRLGAAAIALSGRSAAPLAQTVRYALTLAAQQTGETALLAAPTPDGPLVVAAVESLWTLHSPADVGDAVTEVDDALHRAIAGDADEDGLVVSTIGMSVEIASAVTAPSGACVAVVALRLPLNRLEQVGVRARRAVVLARRSIENALEEWLSAPRAAVATVPALRPSALAATVDVLGHLAEHPDNVAGTARATGLRPDRVQRLVDACVAAGYLVGGDLDGRLQVSWMIHGWYRASGIPTMVARARADVAATAHATGTCGFITVLKGMRSFTIVEELAMAGVGLRMAAWLGRAHPIVGSDGGPAMVMDFSPDQITVLFPSRNTPRELSRFLERTRRVVRDGVLSMQAYEDAGMVSMSAPIRDASGTVTGAACLVGTTDDMEARRDVLLAETRALADRISAVLGAPAS